MFLTRLFKPVFIFSKIYFLLFDFNLFFLRCIFLSTSSNDEIEVNFGNLKSCKYNRSKATFKRVSTVSTASKSSSLQNDTEPLLTTWVWYWLEDDYTWKTFETGSDAIENEYAKYCNDDGPSKIIYKTKQFKYQLKFDQMVQQNASTKRMRPIRRRPRPYYEKRYFCCYSNCINV